MNEKALAVFKQLQQMWSTLSIGKRIGLIAGTVGVLVAVLAVAMIGTAEKYTYLFTDLNPEDAQGISAKLKEMKIPYRVEAGGSAIQVPEEKVHELRLELAGQGLPRGGGVGFEIFDKSHLGATEFEQRIAHRRALEGELSRTISTVGSVQSARVHLVLPERSVFALNKEQASASVVLRLRPGRNFGKSEVAGVVHLVASAVPGLTEDRVSVVGADGVTLHRPRTDGPGGTSASFGNELQSEREREIASGMEDRARELLERTLGPGHADVRINVELESAAKERTEEHFDPKSTIVRSEQRSFEKNSTGDPATVAGVPGAKSNVPDKTTEGTTTTETTAADGTVVRETTTRNWEIDKVIEKTSIPAGKIGRISVAVLVDGTYGPNKEYIPRNREELDRLGALVKGAVGLNDARGDNLRVEGAPFAQNENHEGGTGSASDKPRWTPPKWAYYAAGGIAAILILAMVLQIRRGAKKVAAEIVAAARKQALTVANAPAQISIDALGNQQLPIGERQAAGMTAEQLKMALPPKISQEVEDIKERIRGEAIQLAAKDPASAAVVLREWLNAVPVNNSQF